MQAPCILNKRNIAQVGREELVFYKGDITGHVPGQISFFNNGGSKLYFKAFIGNPCFLGLCTVHVFINGTTSGSWLRNYEVEDGIFCLLAEVVNVSPYPVMQDIEINTGID